MSDILVIDDDTEITTMLEMILTDSAHRVQTAGNGMVGLKLLRQHNYDLVITDIIMPEVDGFEVIMAINGMHPRPRVIAMTCGSERLSHQYLAEVAAALNVEQVLHKPFSIDELLAVVHVPEECEQIVGPGHFHIG